MGSFLEKIAKRIANAKGGKSAVSDGLTMTGDTPNAIVINPDIQMRTEGFKSFLDGMTELEEATQDDKTQVGAVSNNTAGTLHEILVGHHLNGGNHMIRHQNEFGESPLQAHDRLKSQIHPKDYARINAAAKSAADHLKEHFGKMHPGHEIDHVVHTSKHGDTEKETGVAASQKEDSSDIYVTLKHPKTSDVKKHGVSLKVTGSTDKNITSANLGSGDSGETAKKLIADHRNNILTNIAPKLKDIKNKDDRKDWLRNNKTKSALIKIANKNLIGSVAEAQAKELQNKLDTGNHEEVTSHVRKLLHAHKTPAQTSGAAGFIKHTTFTTAKGSQHDISDPSEDYEDILKDHKNITVKHSGGNVNIMHNGKTFAFQAHKFQSQSDPLSSLSSVGRATNYKMDKPAVQVATPATETKTAPTKWSEETEAPSRHHTLFWGRANPPHAGHEQAYNTVKKAARQNGGTSSMVLSRTQDNKKNPLSPEQKEKHAKRAFPDVSTSVADESHPTILHQISKLHERGVTDLHLVAGSDRHKEYNKLINDYNGVKGAHGYYNFKNVTMHSAGERDPDSEGTAGVSATTQRMHAAAGRHKEFAKNTPSTMKSGHAKELYNDVRSGMGGPSATTKKIIKKAN